MNINIITETDNILIASEFDTITDINRINFNKYSWMIGESPDYVYGVLHKKGTLVDWKVMQNT